MYACVCVCVCRVFVEAIWSERNGPDRGIPVATTASAAAVGFLGEMCQRESVQEQRRSDNGHSSMVTN